MSNQKILNEKESKWQGENRAKEKNDTQMELLGKIWNKKLPCWGKSFGHK